MTHRTAPDTIRYTTMFVREDLQAFGLAFVLQAESIRLHLETSDPRLHKATFVVMTETSGMITHVRKRMASYIEEINESIHTTKVLAEP